MRISSIISNPPIKLIEKDMEREELVLMEEIWMPCKKGEGGAISRDGKNYKQIAVMVNGFPLVLEKDFILEKRHITKEEEKMIRSRFPIKGRADLATRCPL